MLLLKNNLFNVKYLNPHILWLLLLLLHCTLIIYYLYCIPIKENSHFSANTATQQHEKVFYFVVELSPAEVKNTHMETCMYSAILNTCFSCEILCGRPSLSSFYPYITVQFDTVNSNPWQCFLSNPVRHSCARIEKKVKFESFAQAFQYANVVNSTVA